MHNAHKRYALFIGRWQPLHDGHRYLIDQALAKGQNVCVAIRNTEISARNPYTVEQRAEMIKRLYGDRAAVIVIPDIASINVGRNVGYDVNFIDPPGDIAEISGTNVRAGTESGIPAEVEQYIRLLRSTIWLTGLPCSGKTTIADRLREELENQGYRAVRLDGDAVRGTLNADLGYSHEDRKENLRRSAHVARLFNDNGSIVVASFVSPTEGLRRMVRDAIGNFKLVYVRCSVETCQKRDVKGMYARARAGELRDFTGISAPFEEPERPDIRVDTEKMGVEQCVRHILDRLETAPRMKPGEPLKTW